MRLVVVTRRNVLSVPWSNRIRILTPRILFRVTEDGFDLGAGHAGEPFEEVVDAGAVLEVGEKGLDRDSRPAENPGAADGLGLSFDGWAGAPIKHAKG
jgi:hypothetical protein